MAPRTFRRVARTARPSVRDGVRFVRMSRRSPLNLPPVIVNHGWPQSNGATTTLLAQRSAYLNALLASGYTLYLPFTGSNWGHPTDSSPDLGGGALEAFDVMVDAAAADGLTSSKVCLYSTSMGGCNALNWAWRNPSKIQRIYLVAPLVDFGATWDTALASVELTPGGDTIRESMTAVWGGSDKASFLAASADGNPALNKELIAPLGSKIKAMLASGDEVIPHASALQFMADIGATVDVQPGSHFFPTTWTSWSELSVASWLRKA